MEHNEAVEMMAPEKYLLDELTPELREAYEDHLFGCPECANDALFGAAFVHHAKVLLPTMRTANASSGTRAGVPLAPKDRVWFAWLRPAFMVPVFASLVACLAYQNIVVFPALETAANEPRILPSATVLHDETRGGEPVVHADLVLGSTVIVELPQNAGYASYKFDFYDSKNKLIWTQTTVSGRNSEETVTLWLPGRIKQDTYKLAVSGVTAGGEDVPVQQHFFELQTNK